MADRAVSSQEFRRTYARLTEPVVVTAHGRPIGRWTPAGFAIEGVNWGSHNAGTAVGPVVLGLPPNTAGTVTK